MTSGQSPDGNVQEHSLGVQNATAFQEPRLFNPLGQHIYPQVKVRPFDSLFVVSLSTGSTGSMCKACPVPTKQSRGQENTVDSFDAFVYADPHL